MSAAINLLPLPTMAVSSSLADGHGFNAAAAALAGLTASPKTLPPALFYDARGCLLFEQITDLPEYYPTRTELALLRSVAPEIGACLPPGAALIEYGASSSTKAEILLDAMARPAVYVPIDVAETALSDVAARMRLRSMRRRAPLAVAPLWADFLDPLMLPADAEGLPRVGFFPGSTIGNLEPESASRFLAGARTTLGDDAHFVAGVDLVKDPDVLIAAYDDAAGVTAAFNRNMLVRLNREAGGDFEVASFDHRAVWNADARRIEMHLVSRRDQVVRVAGITVPFAADETIHTENSYKHTQESVRAMAAGGGWDVLRMWTDPQRLFSIHLLRAAR